MSLISNAHADGLTGFLSGSNTTSLMSFLPMVIIFALFWLLLIRPQQKKMKLHNQMLTSLEPGVEVTTTGGMIGKIVKLQDNLVELEIAPATIVTFQRSAIAGKLAKEVSK